MSYEEFINQCRERSLPEGVYTEKHHIVPRCKNGRTTKDNLIRLTGQEHYEAHRLLALENPNDISLQLAWSIMAYGPCNNDKRQIMYDADDYAKLKEISAKANAIKFTGRKLSDEHKEKLSKALKGKPSKMKGKHHTEETKRKISEKLKGKPQKGHYGHPCKEEVKIKLSKMYKGRKNYWIKSGQKRSEETKEKIRQNTIKQLSRPVECIETGIIYSSRKEAAEAVGCKQQNISRAITYPSRTASNYHWKNITHDTKTE